MSSTATVKDTGAKVECIIPILNVTNFSASIDYNGSFLRGSFVYLGGCSTNLMEILNKLSSLKRWKTFEMGKGL